MMSLADIIQLIVLCAVIFFPLGYLAQRYATRITAFLHLIFIKPRYVKPDGILRRNSVKADHRHD